MKTAASLLVTVFFLVSLHGQEVNRGYIVEVGQMAPDFETISTEGDTFRLSEQRGKVVMLQFTASWCSVCRKEMPFIEEEIWQVHKNDDFVLIGLDRDEPMETVVRFREKMQVTYPLAPDDKADIFGLYAHKQSGVTRNVIIDRTGKIVYLTRLFDLEEFNAMKEHIGSLLKID